AGPNNLRKPRPNGPVPPAGKAAPLLLPALCSRRGSGAGAGRDAPAAARRDAGSHPWTGRADRPLRPFLTPGMGVPLADQADRDRIRDDLSTTLLVEAAAGTGKTTALVGRMLAALASGRARLDRMVAVTFTDAAAGELKLRLRDAIERGRHQPGRPAAERTRLEEALPQLEGARIGPIPSFCAELLRERPVEARVDPQFQVAPDDVARRLFARVFDRWFGAHPPPPAPGG